MKKPWFFSGVFFLATLMNGLGQTSGDFGSGLVDDLVTARSPNSVVIPLKKIKYPEEFYRLGIEAGIGGAPSRLYMFDTGSGTFMSGWDAGAPWWGEYDDLGVTGNAGYMGGFAYQYTQASATVRLSASVTGVVKMARVTGVTADHDSFGVENSTIWAQNLRRGVPPIFANFFGVLGADLSSERGLFSALPQLPENLSSGFIVHTGGRSAGHPASLTIGLTPALRAEFPIALPMRSRNPGALTTFPNSGQPTYNQQLLAGNMTVSDGVTTQVLPVNLILDTGAPQVMINQNQSLALDGTFLSGNFLKPDVTLTFRVAGVGGGEGLVWNFTSTVEGEGSAAVITSTSTDGGAVNLGINVFLNYDVMFDVAEGEVRLRPLPKNEAGASLAPEAVRPAQAAQLRTR